MTHRSTIYARSGALALALGSYSFPSFAQSTAPSANPAYSASTAPAFSGPSVTLEKNESPSAQAERLKTWQKVQREQSLRNFFSDNGFPDKTLQDAILSSAKEREVALRQARVNVLESKRQLYNALLVDKAAPEQIGKITEQYQEAIDTYRKQGLALDGALDAKVGFGKQLKLKGLLLMLGLIGEPAPFPSSWGIAGTLSGPPTRQTFSTPGQKSSLPPRSKGAEPDGDGDGE